MKLEEQVTSLELSKKLKSLGVKQDGHFSWTPSGLKRKNEGHGYNRLTIPDAFTVAELGAFLPQSISYEKKDTIWYTRKHEFPNPTATSAKNEADSRAKMLIHLIEKGIIKP